MAKKTILLVDDDSTFLETNAIVLEKNYNIRTASSGDECLKEVKKAKPDLVIMDVMMSHLSDGFETAKKLKADKQTKDLPVILLTAVNERYDYTNSVADNYFPRDAFLEKPVTPERLLTEVKKLIG